MRNVLINSQGKALLYDSKFLAVQDGLLPAAATADGGAVLVLVTVPVFDLVIVGVIIEIELF